MKKPAKNSRKLSFLLNVFELSILTLDTLTLKKELIIRSKVSSKSNPKKLLVFNKNEGQPYLLKRLIKQVIQIVEIKVIGKLTQQNNRKIPKKTRLLKQYVKKFKYFYSREYVEFYRQNSIKYNKKKLNTIAIWSLFFLSAV